MDPHPRERERTNAGEDQYPPSSRGYSACRDDNSEMASVTTPPRHPTEIRSRQHATRNARYELRIRVGVSNTSTDSPIASGQQRSVVEPTANGIFTKRDSSIRPNTGRVVPKPSEEICLLQRAFNVDKGAPDQHSVFEPDTPTARRGMDNEDRAS